MGAAAHGILPGLMMIVARFRIHLPLRKVHGEFASDLASPRPIAVRLTASYPPMQSQPPQARDTLIDHRLLQGMQKVITPAQRAVRQGARLLCLQELSASH